MAHLYLSIGTNTQTFDDLTITVHDADGTAKGVMILTPADTRKLLSEIAEVTGRDNNQMWKIELHPVSPTPYNERFKFFSKLETETA